MKENHRADDLRKCDWQYSVKHKTTSSFTIGEKVFLKSNPEVPLEVIGLDSAEVYCKLLGRVNTPNVRLIPEVLCKYRFAGLQTYRGKFHICLN